MDRQSWSTASVLCPYIALMCVVGTVLSLALGRLGAIDFVISESE